MCSMLLYDLGIICDFSFASISIHLQVLKVLSPKHIPNLSTCDFSQPLHYCSPVIYTEDRVASDFF